MMLLAVFAAIALGLSIVGLYGVISYSVARRTHEIGVRMALGAETKHVLKLVLKEGALLTLIGITIGTMVAVGLTRVLAGLLYGVSTTDPVTFGVVGILLSLVALIASCVPALRASKVDPIQALHYE